MSLGRMKGFVLIACYRLLWTVAQKGFGRSARGSTLGEDVVLHLLFVEHDDDALEDALGVLAAGVDRERAAGLLGAARLVNVAVETEQGLVFLDDLLGSPAAGVDLLFGRHLHVLVELGTKVERVA